MDECSPALRELLDDWNADLARHVGYPEKWVEVTTNLMKMLVAAHEYLNTATEVDGVGAPHVNSAALQEILDGNYRG